MLVVAILYIRHSPRPDQKTTQVHTVKAALAAGGDQSTATTAAPTGADRLLPAAYGVDTGVETATTIARVDPISLAEMAAKADAEVQAAAAATAAERARATTTTVKKVVAKPVTTSTTKPAPAATTTVPITAASAPATTTTITATPGTFGSGQTETGTASWFGATNGTCAHRTLPFGTIVKVTRLRTGATATCRVNDRGPSDGSRLIDLADDVFEALAPKGAGLMPVKIEW